MTAWICGAAVFVLLMAGTLVLVERRWRTLCRRELVEEIALGILLPEDLAALSSFDRFRRRWQQRPDERRALRRMAVSLAQAKARQRRSAPGRRRFLQLEILTLRTRLRGLRQPPA